MTNVIDGPGRYKTRSGDVVEVSRVTNLRAYEGVGTGYWYLGGARGGFAFHPLDIVEKLPDVDVTFESAPPMGKEFGAEPTAEASDGKQYPVEWFTVQQRFDDVKPPIGPDLRIHENDYSLSGVYDFDDKNNVYEKDTFFCRGERFEETNSTWTLAPLPPKPKEAANVWDEYLTDSGLFWFYKSAGKNLGGPNFYINEIEAAKWSEKIDALHAWKNHILSQEKG